VRVCTPPTNRTAKMQNRATSGRTPMYVDVDAEGKAYYT
jgi:hypothetical protein